MMFLSGNLTKVCHSIQTLDPQFQTRIPSSTTGTELQAKTYSTEIIIFDWTQILFVFHNCTPADEDKNLLNKGSLGSWST